MPFYHFRQNNTGGSFVVDENLNVHTVIEAGSLQDAIARAERIGIYFNGCDEGLDCHCCGDRWGQPRGEQKLPHIYGDSIKKKNLVAKWDGTNSAFNKTTQRIVVHYLDGSRKYGYEK